MALLGQQKGGSGDILDAGRVEAGLVDAVGYHG